MTLIAVFLALGLGLLLGGTLGEEVIVKEQVELLQRLEDRYTQSKADNSKLVKQASLLEERAASLEGVMSKMGGHYVRDRLIGKNIALLQLEQGDLPPLLSTLEQAGANVTATLHMNTAALEDPDPLQRMRRVLGLDGGASLREIYGRLAGALAGEMFGGQGTSVLNSLKEVSAAAVTGSFGGRVDGIVLIGGVKDNNKNRLAWFDAPLLRQLTELGITVVGAERSDVVHSGVTYYREFGISTVDNLDQVTGRVALIDLLGGARGHYGTKKTAEALLPTVTTAKEVSAGR